MASLHSEVGSVPTRFLRGLHLDRPNEVSSRLHNLRDLDIDSTHLVPARLHENHVIRPLDLPAISVGPLLSEDLAWLDLVLVAEAFLHKAALEPRLATLSFVFKRLWLNNLWELAHDLHRGLRCFSYLEH